MNWSILGAGIDKCTAANILLWDSQGQATGQLSTNHNTMAQSREWVNQSDP